MHRNAVALIALLVLAGCATAGRQASTRPNSDLDPATVAGPESEDWDTPPKLLRGKTPVYPISQALSKRSGDSVIAYTIGTDGKPKDFEVVSTTDRVYADHAIIALRAWVFRPAMKDGAPVEARVRQKFGYGMR